MRIVVHTACSAVLRVIQQGVIGPPIISWTIAITTPNQVSGQEKFQLLAGRITEARLRKNSAKIILFVDLPVKAADRDRPFLFKRIQVQPEDEVKVILNLEPCDRPDWNINGSCCDIVSSVVDARFEFEKL